MIKPVKVKYIPTPCQLLNNTIIEKTGKENKIYKNLLSRENLKILDLGTKVPIVLMYCYHNFRTKKLIGVDILTNEDKALMAYIKKFQYTKVEEEQELVEYIKDKCFSFYDLYEHLFTKEVVSTCKNSTLIKKEDFKQTITTKLNTKIEDYLTEDNKELFDIIICNNVLHLIDDDTLIKKMKSKLNTNGLIYIRVQNHKSYDKSFFIAEINKNFESGFIYESSKKEKWHSLMFINKNFE